MILNIGLMYDMAEALTSNTHINFEPAGHKLFIEKVMIQRRCIMIVPELASPVRYLMISCM